MTAVLVEERGSVLVVVLNRPEVLNAVDGALTRALGEALDHLETSAGLRVGVLTGAGRAFCAGMDLRAVAAGAPVAATRHPEWGFAGITSRELRKPVVAAVNGDAVGGGLEIALACDVVVAAAGARCGLPEVRHGLIAAGGGIQRLVQQLPGKLALDLLLTGRLVPVETLQRHGLVSDVVPPDELLERALDLAAQIAQNAPLAVAATRRLAAAATSPSVTAAEVRDRTDGELEALLGTDDVGKAITAFGER